MNWLLLGLVCIGSFAAGAFSMTWFALRVWRSAKRLRDDNFLDGMRTEQVLTREDIPELDGAFNTETLSEVFQTRREALLRSMQMPGSVIVRRGTTNWTIATRPPGFHVEEDDDPRRPPPTPDPAPPMRGSQP